MPSCERCWADSALARYMGDHDAYSRLLKERANGCTPEQQAGPEATKCPICHRKTLHQLCGICMVGCGTARDGRSSDASG
jgi:hypothetical protein